MSKIRMLMIFGAIMLDYIVTMEMVEASKVSDDFLWRREVCVLRIQAVDCHQGMLEGTSLVLPSIELPVPGHFFTSTSTMPAATRPSQAQMSFTLGCGIKPRPLTPNVKAKTEGTLPTYVMEHEQLSTDYNALIAEKNAFTQTIAENSRGRETKKFGPVKRATKDKGDNRDTTQLLKVEDDLLRIRTETKLLKSQIGASQSAADSDLGTLGSTNSVSYYSASFGSCFGGHPSFSLKNAREDSEPDEAEEKRRAQAISIFTRLRNYIDSLLVEFNDRETRLWSYFTTLNDKFEKYTEIEEGQIKTQVGEIKNDWLLSQKERESLDDIMVTFETAVLCLIMEMYAFEDTKDKQLNALTDIKNYIESVFLGIIKAVDNAPQINKLNIALFSVLIRMKKVCHDLRLINYDWISYFEQFGAIVNCVMDKIQSFVSTLMYPYDMLLLRIFDSYKSKRNDERAAVEELMQHMLQDERLATTVRIRRNQQIKTDFGAVLQKSVQKYEEVLIKKQLANDVKAEIEHKQSEAAPTEESEEIVETEKGA